MTTSANPEECPIEDIPSGWAWASLSDVAEIAAGNAAPQGKEHFDPNGVPFVRVKDMGQLERAAWMETTQDRLTGETADRLRLFPSGAVLFTKSGASTLLNQRAILVREMCVVSHIGVALPIGGVTTSEWLYYWLSCIDLAHYAHATTLPSVPLSRVKSIQVPVAPAREQVRVVECLDKTFAQLDAGVSALKRAEDSLGRYRASVLRAAIDGSLTTAWRKRNLDVEPADRLLNRILVERRRRWEQEQVRHYEATGKRFPKNWRARYKEPVAPDRDDLPALPDTWCWASFDQLGDIQSGLQKSPARSPRSNHYPYLRVANVLRGTLDLTTLHRFELQPQELEKLRLIAGDLLFVEGNGSRREIGRCAVWRGDIANCVHQNHIIRVRPAAGFLPDYAEVFVNSPQGQQAVQKRSSSTSGLYTLSARKIRDLAIPLPPPEEQEAIAISATRAGAEGEAIEASLGQARASLPRLRQAVLQRAFAGRLVPQNPDDEPASALLRRIAAPRRSPRDSAKLLKNNGKETHRDRGDNALPVAASEASG